MTRFFCVAQHNFSITLPGSDNIWKHLGSYKPFLREAADELLFSIESVSEEPACHSAEYAYRGKEEPGVPRIDILSCDEGWRIDISVRADNGELRCKVFCDRVFHRAAIFFKDRGILEHTAFSNAVMLLYALSSARFNTLELHSSVVVNNGRAYLFMGHSGAGKSTHSQLWIKHIEGSELLNDDNPVLRVHDDGSIICYGSPWSGKTPCYRNASAPVAAVVYIVQAPHNHISRLSNLDAYSRFLSSCSGFRCDPDVADGLHASFEKVILGIPFYQLECLPDADAAQTCANNVRG